MLWAAPAVLAAITLTMTACGGSSSHSSSASAQEKAKADAICAHTNTLLSSITLTGKNVTSSAARLSAYYLQEAAELRKLTPPASMAADWRLMATEFEQAGNDAAKFGESAHGGNAIAIRSSLLATQRAHQQAAAVAKRDGLTPCAIL